MRNPKYDLTRENLNLEMYKNAINEGYIYLYKDGKFELIQDINLYNVECRYMEDGKSGINHEISNSLEYYFNSGVRYMCERKHDSSLNFEESITKSGFVKLPDVKNIPLYVEKFIVKIESGKGEDGCHRNDSSINKPYPKDTYALICMWQQWFNSVDDFYIKDEMIGERDKWRDRVVFSFDWNDISERFKDNTFEYNAQNKNDNYDKVFFSIIDGIIGAEDYTIKNYMDFKICTDRSGNVHDVILKYDYCDDFVLFYVDLKNRDTNKTIYFAKIGFKNKDGIITNFMKLS